MFTVVPIVSLIVVIVMVIGSTEINQYKGLIVQKVKEATGRDMRIEGDLDLTGSLSPTVVVEGVSFANAPWGLRPQMVTVKRFEAKVALIPLLRGDLQVKRLILIEPDILVETDARGHSNWEFFGLMMTQEPKPPAEADDRGTLALDIAEVQIEKGRLTFRDGISGKTVTLAVKNFSARSDSFNHPIALDLAATFKGHPFNVTGTLGAFNKLVKNESLPVELAVKTGDTEVNVDGSVARAMKGKGIDLALTMKSKSLADLSWLAGTDLPDLGPIRITAKVSDEKGAYTVKDLKAAFGKSDLSGDVTVAVGGMRPKVSARLSSTLIDLTKVPPTNPLPLLKALLSADADGTFKAKYIHAPGMALKQVDAALNPKSGRQRANLALTMKADSLADLSRLAGTDLPAFGPFSITAKVSEEKEAYTVKDFKVTVGNSDLSGEVTVALGGKRPNVSARLASVLIDFLDFMPASGIAPEEDASGEKLIFPAYELPLDALRWADADVTLKAKYIHAPGVTLKQVNVAPSLKGGRLRVKQAKARLAGGTVSADMTMDASSKTAKLSTQLDAKEVEVGRLLEQVDLTDVMSGGKTDVKIDLKGRGNSVRELMAKLNGRMLVEMGEGRIHNSVANIGAPDLLLEIFHMMNPLSEKDEYTSLRCGVVHIDVKDGIAMTDKGIGAETSKMNLIGSGAINLETEELDLSIHPKAHHGISVNAVSLSNLFRLGGTLAEPKAKPDPVGILKTGTSIGAAVFTNGISLVAEALFNVATLDRSPCATALGKASVGTPANGSYHPAPPQPIKNGGGVRDQLEEISE
jgi:uncharacterized protein involved in outer membrane biogenesis